MVQTTYRNVDYSNKSPTNCLNGKYYDCKFDGAKLTVVFSGQFYNCRFIGTDFSDAQFRSCTFVSCDFTKADFSNSIMASPKFEACCLDHTKFHFQTTQGIWTAKLDASCSIDRAIGVKAVTSERGWRMLIHSTIATHAEEKRDAKLLTFTNYLSSNGYFDDELEWKPYPATKKPAKLLSSNIAELEKK